jgi:hypothetical protein
MPRLATVAALLAALLGCGAFGSGPRPPACDDRRGWWPDEDGDGFGDDAEVVYVGCEPPAGWVDNPPRPPETDETDPPEDPDTDADTADTDSPTDG